MIAPSKLNFNTKTIGYFGSISYSCYECGHTWEPSCCLTTLQTFRDSMKFSLKVYSSFYLVGVYAFEDVAKYELKMFYVY